MCILASVSGGNLCETYFRLNSAKVKEKLDEMSMAFSRSYAFYMGLFKDIQFYKVSCLHLCMSVFLT